VEVGLIGLFIILFTRRFVAGRSKLIEGTKAVSQMELDRPLDIAGNSEELDELARSFDVMRDRLRTALGEINQFTQKLETKVEERTSSSKRRTRSCCRATGWLRWGSFPPAWRTKSTIPFPAC
jgi:methyl-accepting chemotaxis protein